MGAPSSGFSGRPHFGGSMLDDTLKYGTNLSTVCGAEKGGVYRIPRPYKGSSLLLREDKGRGC